MTFKEVSEFLYITDSCHREIWKLNNDLSKDAILPKGVEIAVPGKEKCASKKPKRSVVKAKSTTTRKLKIYELPKLKVKGQIKAAKGPNSQSRPKIKISKKKVNPSVTPREKFNTFKELLNYQMDMENGQEKDFAIEAMKTYREMVKKPERSPAKFKQEVIETVEEYEKEVRPKVLTFAMGTFYSRINGTNKNDNTTADLVSDLSFKGKFNYLSKLGNNKRINNKALFGQITFKEDTSLQLSNRTRVTYFDFSTRWEFLFKDSSILGIGPGIKRDIYLSTLSSSSVGIQTALVPYLNPFYSFEIYDAPGLSSKFQLEGFLSFGAIRDDLNVREGYGAKGSFFSELRRKEKRNLNIEFYYEYLNRNTSVLDINETSIGVNLGVDFDF